MQGQQVAVTVNSARNPDGPAGPPPVGVLVTYNWRLFVPTGRLFNVNAVQFVQPLAGVGKLIAAPFSRSTPRSLAA